MDCHRVLKQLLPGDTEHKYTVSQKNTQNCFCHNFVRFPLTLIMFGTKVRNSLKLYEVHSFSTAPDRHCPYKAVYQIWSL